VHLFSNYIPSRGIGNLILSHISSSNQDANADDKTAKKKKKIHFFSSSGGNAGLAAVIAARDLNCPCTVVVPLSTKPMMVQKLRDAGATEVIQHGASWYEADNYLRERFIDIPGKHINSKAEAMANEKTRPQQQGSVVGIEERADRGSGHSSGTTDVTLTTAGKEEQEVEVKNVYLPPFDHPMIWEGNATLVEELARQLPAMDEGKTCHQANGAPAQPPFPADVIVCSVGGGGLFNGVIAGLDRHIHKNDKQTRPVDHNTRPVHVLAAETAGAASLAYSLSKDSLQSLSAITSLATSLGALKVAPQTFRNARAPPLGVKVSSVITSDAEAARGVVRLAEEDRLLVELACGIVVDVAVGVRLKEVVPDLTPESRVVVIVCGGSNVTPEMLCEYQHRLKYGWDEKQVPRMDEKWS
jgi:L-serine/L-threonine ammonia-lyase